MKYSDYFMNSLKELGYTHCFFVGGGNVMHLLESARTRMNCVAVVNEVSAGIAAEYFNVSNRDQNERAFALVTAGPGMTNIVTALSGAWLESRELLVVGGQARTDLLSDGGVRQIGHQEIAGTFIAKTITKLSIQAKAPLSKAEIRNICDEGSSGRMGPVFLEICLDVTAMNYQIPPEATLKSPDKNPNFAVAEKGLGEVAIEINNSQRPIFLLGGGLKYSVITELLSTFDLIGIPIATTWNASDYIDYDSRLYAGRPNTYGMRWANAAIQQADVVVCLGARLGLQQTGFNWEEFVPIGKVVQIDIDEYELKKANPRKDFAIHADVNLILAKLLSLIEVKPREEWLEFIAQLKTELPTAEEANEIYPGYANPFRIVDELSDICSEKDSVITCSSGGSYTSMMQAFRQKKGQLLTNNKGLASMGYGLAGAIGSAFANREGRTFLVEGDGGFAQNLSELGTVSVNFLNLKMILFVNGGYASIRISQKAYFDGNYLGCDSVTGLGQPNWEEVFRAYSIPTVWVDETLKLDSVKKLLEDFDGPVAILVKINVDQPFLPKVTSKIFEDGSMKSNPIHLMHPPLEQDVMDRVFRFLPENLR